MIFKNVLTKQVALVGSVRTDRFIDFILFFNFSFFLLFVQSFYKTDNLFPIYAQETVGRRGAK